MPDPRDHVRHLVFLLGILFRHRAFRAPSFTLLRQLDGLNIYSGEQELLLLRREDLHNTFIFRQAFETLTSYKLFCDALISPSMIFAGVKRIRELFKLRPNHDNSTPFRRNCLRRHIGADVWSIICGKKPQQAIIKQSCSLGYSRNKRRAVDLTPAQAASILTYPIIKRGFQAHSGIPKRNSEYKKARQWTAEQAVDNIERRSRGSKPAKPPRKEGRAQQPAQRKFVQELTAPVVTTLEGQCRRRDDAIAAISAYCLV
ncbi:hypothetical protein F4782DRAFT_534557 [Xylaria castorea]|nr:hypothetical protein F4782DRAFT_534557 [Xylaria castorea]